MPSGASKTPADGLAGPLAPQSDGRAILAGINTPSKTTRPRAVAATGTTMPGVPRLYNTPRGKVVAQVSEPVFELPVPVPIAGARPRKAGFLRATTMLRTSLPLSFGPPPAEPAERIPTLVEIDRRRGSIGIQYAVALSPAARASAALWLPPDQAEALAHALLIAVNDWRADQAATAWTAEATDVRQAVRATCNSRTASPGCLYPKCDCQKLPKAVAAALSGAAQPTSVPTREVAR